MPIYKRTGETNKTLSISEILKEEQKRIDNNKVWGLFAIVFPPIHSENPADTFPTLLIRLLPEIILGYLSVKLHKGSATQIDYIIRTMSSTNNESLLFINLITNDLGYTETTSNT